MQHAVQHATIAAIATAPGRGAVGIIRISGPRAREVLRDLAPQHTPTPRFASLASIEVDGAVVDQSLVLFFPAPRSYTGEDVVELQLHGAPRLLDLVLARVVSLDGVRLATPGEFTRRAVMAGRLDLTRAEAVIDLIDARSTAEVTAAAARLSGALSTLINTLHQPLAQLSAMLEGALDFPDEAEGIEVELPQALEAVLKVSRRLEAEARAAWPTHGAKVVLYGPVNAGKSTLFNRLVGEPRALVDAEPGTTRDAIEATVEWNGQLVHLLDTAGLRANAGRIEALGIERTKQLLAEADVAVLLVPPEAPLADRAAWQAEVEPSRRLDVATKRDLGSTAVEHGWLSVSGASGAGVEALQHALVTRLRPNAGEATVLNRLHLAGLTRVRECVERARTALTTSTLEVVAGEVGLALAASSELAGERPSEARLDALFERFCIGK